MLRKLSIALLLLSAPAIAQDAPPPDQGQGEVVTDAKPLPYKLKKVCRTQEVVGSSIGRRVCTTKRVYLKPGEEASVENKSSPEPESHSRH